MRQKSHPVACRLDFCSINWIANGAHANKISRYLTIVTSRSAKVTHRAHLSGGNLLFTVYRLLFTVYFMEIDLEQSDELV